MSERDKQSQQMALTTRDALQALKTLCRKIAVTIEVGTSEGVLRPTQEVYERYPIDELSVKQGEFGLERSNFTTEEVSRESWFRATHTVVWRLQESLDWSAVLTVLEQTTLNDENAKRLLESFAHRFSYKFLETDDATQRDDFVSQQLEAVTKHLENQLFRHTSEVRLIGFLPPSDSVEFTSANVDVRLRRVERGDLVEEQSSFFDRDRFPPTPTAILRLGKIVTYDNGVQKMVWQAITVLRLFKVGSVRELSYTRESDSFFAFCGTHSSHQHFGRVTTAIMNSEEVEVFKRFWTALMSQLPPDGYGRIRESVDPIEISYNRYSDALLSWGVPAERRLSDAVIGLESLFLVQADELSYRLRLFVAKLLGIFGFDVYEVKETVGLAYEVRSSFLHGSHVSRKMLRKIDAKHRGLHELLLKLLDYLRCSISIQTLTGIKKPELVSRLEASFIDEAAWQQLNELLEEARQLVRPSV